MPARDTAVSESKGPKEKEKDSRALSEINGTGDQDNFFMSVLKIELQSTTRLQVKVRTVGINRSMAFWAATRRCDVTSRF